MGLGQVGLPVAEYAKQRGFDVYGYDISPEAIERAVQKGSLKPADNFKDFDAYILCVSTHKQDDIFSPQIDGLISIAKQIAEEAKEGALVSIESTIPMGTSRKVFEILGNKLHVAHAPHRWYALEEKEHGVNQLRVVGGVQNCCLETAMKLYSKNERSISESKINLGIPFHPVSPIEIAELTKIIENAHRYLQIAFAEDLYLYCLANNLSFQELRGALNTKWNVNILEPRDGIGGTCLPKDTKMFLESSSLWTSKILSAAMEVDLNYRHGRLLETKPLPLSVAE